MLPTPRQSKLRRMPKGDERDSMPDSPGNGSDKQPLPVADKSRQAGTILPDVLGPNLKVVFCGTAAGAVSAKRRAYYAGPGNKFWQTIHKSASPIAFQAGRISRG